MPVKEALEYYRRLNEGCIKQFSDEKDQSDEEVRNDNESESGSSSPSNLKRILSKTASFTSLRSRASSRASGLVRAASSRETDPDLDATETEVEVSERTSKFKISTEASRRNSYERKGSIDRRYSVERTVSPRLLEERLRTHAEAEVELHPPPSEQEEERQREATNTSFLERIKHFSGRQREKAEHSTADAGGNSASSPKYHGVLKRKGASADTSTPKASSSLRAHISFASFAVRVDEGSCPSALDVPPPPPAGASIPKGSSAAAETNRVSQCEGKRLDQKLQRDHKKIERHDCVEASPTRSERLVSSPNSFLRSKKKFSLSLDVLPRRNGRSTKGASAQRVSSDDLLSRTSPPPKDAPKRHSHNSPKMLKKKQESAKAILMRSLSFKRKSPSSKDVPSSALQVASGNNSQEIL